MAVFGNCFFFYSQIVLFLILNCGLLLPSVGSVAAVAAIQPAKNEELSRLEALFHRQLDQFNSEIDQLKKQLRDSREDSKRKIDKLEQEIRQLNLLLHTDVPTAGNEGEIRSSLYDSKTVSGVYFYVQRQTSYNITRSIIPYELEQLNIGSAMDLALGVFTVPFDGVYYFHFVARSNSALISTLVDLRVNGQQIVISEGYVAGNNMPLHATLLLKTGDKVDVYLNQGSIFELGDRHQTHFSGFLLQKDVIDANTTLIIGNNS